MSSNEYKSLKDFREKKGLSQLDLAEISGKTQGNISRFESGENTLSCQVAGSLAPYLDTTGKELFTEHSLYMLQKKYNDIRNILDDGDFNGPGLMLIYSKVRNLYRAIADSWLWWSDNERLDPTKSDSEFTDFFQKFYSLAGKASDQSLKNYLESKGLSLEEWKEVRSEIRSDSQEGK